MLREDDFTGLTGLLALAVVVVVVVVVVVILVVVACRSSGSKLQVSNAKGGESSDSGYRQCRGEQKW